MTRARLLAELTHVLGRQVVTHLCTGCGALLGPGPHTCDPEEASARILTSQWRALLSGRGPMDRAKSYRVA